MDGINASIINHGKILMLLLAYMFYDLLIFGSNILLINETKNLLSNYFDMKDLGEANFIMGMKITKTLDGFLLDQSHYIEKILKKYNYFDCLHHLIQVFT